MERKVQAVVFDVVETLFSLEALRPRLQRVGLGGQALEVWFAELLRDAFALGITGDYQPFRDVAAGSLDRLLSSGMGVADGKAVENVLDGFAELDAHADVAPAMQHLVRHDIRIFTLTNGDADVTRKLLDRAGLLQFVERSFSIDEVQRWKPAVEVYRHCARQTGVAPERLALIAAHDWDVHGAHHAGLLTGYVSRVARPVSTVMSRPDVSGSSLTEVVEAMAAR